MKDQLKAVMIQMNEIYAELREIRGQKTKRKTTVTTTTRVTGSSSSDRSEEGLGVDPLLLAKEGRWEAYYADQTRRFLEAQWSRMTLKIIRRWENEFHCMASNTRHKIKWTRILAERRLLKAGG